MVTIARFIAIAILSLFMTSCIFNFDSGIKGNRNVVSEERDAEENFTVIKASEGLDVYITQSETASIEVEADENVIGLIATDINNGVLKIHTEKNIGRCKSKKVFVSLPVIEKIIATSGSDIFSTSTIIAETLEVKSNSGADVKLEVEAENIICATSSGADIKIAGTADSLEATASSGSDINAGDLTVKNCNASASSGGDVTVYVTEKLVASSSSGGDVNYYGNPPSVAQNKSSAGGVNRK
ncbi:putative autotransporter adhesin-like protein [Kordia periserrulae]|uniref:Putative autotransporter adhesin-like protein n=1 Tax=Kordia periserrulae TaxID=701523 RepID=A0A2T6C126_9FLAO|nr:head GIN domain-containing protein [Kordia periserrulae]PTX62021.1 putative autotransporter adhesin-like protein [Kordia periserrulae]